jgi:transcriptional regulator with GAF, ATPase, and Fis domain
MKRKPLYLSQQTTTTMTLSQLQTEKATLLNTVNELVAIKKGLYSNMDIEQPMSKEEKDLNAQIASLYSQVNKVVKQIRGIK